MSSGGDAAALSRKEAAGRSKASEQAGQQARHPEKAPNYLLE
jgi:hypothetical protein